MPRHALRGALFLVCLVATAALAQQPIHLTKVELAASDLPTPPPEAAADEPEPGDPDTVFADPGAGDVYVGALADAAPGGSPDAAAKKQAAAEKKKREDLKKAIATAYAPVFYNNKFDYIDNPLYDDWHPGDHFKNMKFGPCCNWTLDIGGQYRARQHAELNHRGLGVTGADDYFLLHRTRIFGNLKLGDRFRIFAEGIDAESNYENFAPRGIEVNRADMLNLFADAVLYECDKKTLTARVGRQELLYGNQRLVSPLDWANTRRTFEGVNFLWRGDDWNCDVFFVEPVAVDPIHFDSAVDEQEFFGFYATYKALKDQTIDLFGLQYNNALAPRNFQYTTLGGRWQGTKCDWLWEAEGGVQFGENTDGSGHSAGYWTAGFGRKFDHCWKPTLWGYYDWASGGPVQGAGQGFDHLFPLAHKYLGYMDLFARSNIQSPNVLLTFSPREKINVLLWYYYFYLESAGDTPYNVNMTPYAPGHAPPSRDLGHELDLTVQYVINPRMDVLFGFSHFFPGAYYQLSAAPAQVPYRGDASFFYTQFTWNF